MKHLDKIPTREPAAEPIREPAAEKVSSKHTKSKLKLEQKFINEIIADEKDINNEIFLDCFKYQNPSFLIKDLISAE